MKQVKLQLFPEELQMKVLSHSKAQEESFFTSNLFILLIWTPFPLNTF